MTGSRLHVHGGQPLADSPLASRGLNQVCPWAPSPLPRFYTATQTCSISAPTLPPTASSWHKSRWQSWRLGQSSQTEDLEDLGTFWTQEKQYSSLSFLTTEHLRALIKNHEVRSPFVTLFSLAVHSSLESQSYTSTLFSTSEKWDRARTLSLFYFRISEAGGISSKGNSNYLLLELMLAFLIHQSLLRCSQQSWCLLPMCTSAYVCGACMPVCTCAYVRVNLPTGRRRGRPSLEDSFHTGLDSLPRHTLLSLP